MHVLSNENHEQVYQYGSLHKIEEDDCFEECRSKRKTHTFKKEGNIVGTLIEVFIQSMLLQQKSLQKFIFRKDQCTLELNLLLYKRNL
jgi:hypothetical protein